jgi:hypothetical protein
MARDRELDATAIARKQALHKRDVSFLNRAVTEIVGKLGVGEIVLGDEENARGLFIEAVDDAGTEGIVGLGKVETAA